MRRTLLPIALAFAIPSAAQADLTFTYIDWVTGDDPGVGSPYGELVTADTATDEVTLTFTADSNLPSGTFVSGLHLNIGPFPTDLAFSSEDAVVEGVFFSEDGVSSVFDLSFDAQVMFMNDMWTWERLEPGETATLKITGTGLDSSDFNTLAAGQATTILSLMILEGTGPDQIGTTYLAPVPEPATAAALGLGLAALAFRRRQARRV